MFDDISSRDTNQSTGEDQLSPNEVEKEKGDIIENKQITVES